MSDDRRDIWKHFWWAACVAAAVAASAPAYADKFASLGSGWQRYSNDLYGSEFDFPAHVFTAAPAPNSADGRQFTSDDATLEIFATPNDKRETATSWRRHLLQEKQGYDHVTYAPSGENWFVLSGFRGEMIFYEKYLFRDGLIHAFGIEFPANAKPFYAPIIERIEDSFGKSAPTAALARRAPTRPSTKPEPDAVPERDPLVIY